MSASERLTARLLKWAPLLSFLACTLPLPAYFLLRYFAASENPGEEMILALSFLGLGALVGLLAATAFFFYRRLWERRLRERLAADGVTTDELSWFMSELPSEQRRALERMERQNPLLADAYRETLAASITARRVLARTRRETTEVERRMNSAAGFQAANRTELERDLRQDGARLSRVEREAAEHQETIETRLQMIEALADRDASVAETELALQRLGSVRENVPIGLTDARAEQAAREEIEKELRGLPPTQSR
jgi:hypothetical protein